MQIECLPYEEVLSRYDRPSTLFYLDPPYYGRKLYRYNFDPGDFRNSGGAFGDVTRQVRALAERRSRGSRDLQSFKIRGIDLPYTAQKHAGRRYREVLITNF